MTTETTSLRGQIEAVLLEPAVDLEPGRPNGRGRSPILPAAVLWTALALGVLRGAMSQLAIWRLILDAGPWRGRRIVVSGEAVYRRLARAPEPSPMATLFAQITTMLADRAVPDQTLAPFATAVVALDETTLACCPASSLASSTCAASSGGWCASSPIRTRTRRWPPGIWPRPWRRARSSSPIWALAASPGSTT